MKFCGRSNGYMPWVIYHESWLIWKIMACRVRFWKEIRENYHVVVVESNYCVGSPSVFLSKNLKFCARSKWHISWVIYTMSYNSYERLYLVKCRFGKKFETKYHVVVVERKTFFPLNRSIAPPHGWINLIFFTKYLWRHARLRYDVIFYDS